jgi:hypothetical protein
MKYAREAAAIKNNFMMELIMNPGNAELRKYIYVLYRMLYVRR